MTDTDLHLDLSTLDRDLADAERERAAARLSRLSPAGAALLDRMRQALAQGRNGSEPSALSRESAHDRHAPRLRDGGGLGGEGGL